MPIPTTFQNLADHYPTKETKSRIALLTSIFGADSWEAGKKPDGRDNISNTCAIRMSHALNLAQLPISLNTVKNINQERKQGGGSQKKWLVQGGSNGSYFLKVNRLIVYLHKAFGVPNVDVKGVGSTLKAAVSGKKGIIVFRVKWRDATGHVDLWDGSRAIGSSYFDEAYQVLLWETQDSHVQSQNEIELSRFVRAINRYETISRVRPFLYGLLNNPHI